MPAKASLLDTIAAMRDLANSGFQQQVKNWTDKLYRAPLQISDDLSCPSEILDVLKQVMEVVDAFESDMNQGVDWDSWQEGGCCGMRLLVSFAALSFRVHWH